MGERTDEEQARIVIAEDNQELCEVLKTILENEMYMVKFVPDGLSLIAYLKDTQDVDVIVLDLIMPERTGMSVFSTVRSVSPASKLIIYTGYSDYKNSVFAKEADAFVDKVEGVEKLLEVIKKLLE
jgi:DNA-binding NtrC family response regulator